MDAAVRSRETGTTLFCSHSCAERHIQTQWKVNEEVLLLIQLLITNNVCQGFAATTTLSKQEASNFIAFCGTFAGDDNKMIPARVHLCKCCHPSAAPPVCEVTSCFACDTLRHGNPEQLTYRHSRGGMGGLVALSKWQLFQEMPIKRRQLPWVHMTILRFYFR